MHIENGEVIIHTFRHHYFPYITRLIELCLGFTPIFFLMYFLTNESKLSTITYSFLGVTIFFIFSFLYMSSIYWLDKLIITNKRIIHVDWKNLTLRKEYEAKINEVQDIRTQEKGILSKIGMFDYGIVQIDTASAKSIILFAEAPDPENIKHFIYTNILTRTERERASLVPESTTNLECQTEKNGALECKTDNTRWNLTVKK
jgi:hypothetical protein